MNDDLISRQDAIDALEEQLDYLWMLNKNENPTAEGKWYGVNWARNTIADLPSAQKKGEWDYIQAGMCICPFCGAMPHKLYKTYCAKCGAELKGSAE